MTKKLMFLVVILLVSIPAFAQSIDTAWVRSYNGLSNFGDVVRDVVVDTAGNVYVTGKSVGSDTTWDFLTIKYDASGNQLWVRRYNGPGARNDEASTIVVDDFGSVYITGGSNGAGLNYDYATIKYDAEGNELWVRRYNGSANASDYANSIALDDSGNVYVTGDSQTDTKGADCTTIKYAPDGNELWIRRCTGCSHAVAIVVDNSGFVYITGKDQDDYATVKYDRYGNQLWVRWYHEHSFDSAKDLAVDDSGNVYVTGQSIGSDSYWDYATVKYDPDGNELWVRRYSGQMPYGQSLDYAYSIAVDDSSNVYVTGESAVTSQFGMDWITIKYDKDGNQLWLRRYYGDPVDYDEASASELALDEYGNVYVTGWFEFFDPDDIATLKYDSSGNQLWLREYKSPDNSCDKAYAIAVDNQGNVYVSGESSGDFVTIKYFQNTPPDPFNLLSPTNNTATVIPFMTFDWENATDPDLWDEPKYDFYLSNSSGFHPDSTIIHNELLTSQHIDTLIAGRYYWRVRAYDNYAEIWSNQIWTFIFAKRGDVNADSQLTVSDVVYLVNYLFKDGPAPAPELWYGDVNCDDEVDIADVVYMVNFLFKNGPLPCE